MAKKPHITWRQIYDLNRDLIGSNPDLIQPGMVFTMPNGLPDYTVVKGDYLIKIANRINADIDAEPEEEELPDPEPTPEPDPEPEPEAEPAPPAPKPKPHPILNPLHSYATSTYGITLYVLSKDSYNELVNGTSAAWTPTYTLISSGGWHGNRYKAFQDDFYFDGLTMKTVIGMNSNTRGTNAVEIDFTIVEPYGLTLLDRLMEVADDPTIGNGNYLQQPYLLEIDFFGSDELGDMNKMITNLRKRIPIKILTVKIKVGTKGTEYACKAIPFNHGAFNESNNSAPANFEIKAKTVGEFFDADVTEELSTQVAQKNTERDQFETLKQEIDAAEMAGNTEQLKELSAKYMQLKKTIAAPYSSHSYSGAWNAWNQKVADDKHVAFANRIRFVIDDEIKNSSIVDPSKTAYNRTPMGAIGGGRGGQGGPTAAQAAAGNNPTVSSKTPSNSFDPTKMTFNVTSGTSIVDTINLVMRNSDFIKSQVVDPLSGKDEFPENKPVKYFRVIPSITLLDFDPFRNEYAREITYYIQKYEYFNSKHPNLPKAKPPGPVKQYDYIYTGKNVDIIDLQIDFDTAYHTSVVVNRQNANATNPATGAASTNKADQAAKPAGAGTVAPSTHQPINGDATAQSSGADTAQTVLVANAMKSIYSNSRGDMLNVKLKIVGDPHFIKQDDIYAGPSQGDYDVTEQMINPGTLSMDGREIFCVVQFKTPVDMDDATGLTRENAKYRSSGFSGYYKIVTVTSEFKAGTFVQTLDLIRIFDVPDLSDTGVTILEMDDPKAGAANSTAPAAGKTTETEEEFETPPDEKDDNEDPTPEEEESKQLEEDLQDAEEVDVNDKEETDQDTNDTAAAAPANQPITNWDALSFGEAFSEARKIQGGNGGVFLWRGKEYQTSIKGEKYIAPSELTRINF